MTETPEKIRHYPKIPGFVVRTSADLTPAAIEGRFNALQFLRGSRDPLPDEPRLVSSAHGDLQELLLTIPAYAVEQPAAGIANPLAKAYRILLRKLPKDLRLVILTHESVEAKVRTWLDGVGLADHAILIGAPDFLNFSIWAEDGYVTLEDSQSGESYLLEPYEFPRYADALVADMVHNASHLRNNQAPLYFQGGNLLIGDDFFMIGADYPANTLARYVNRVFMPDPGETPADCVERLYRQFMDTSRRLSYVGSTIPVPAQQMRPILVGGEEWTEIVYFGNKEGTVQPLFHIDMFLSLAGRAADGTYQVLVGDPRMAASLLGVPLLETSMADVFDNIAQGLNRQGFKVIRNPLPLVYLDDPDYRERIWYFATANNALVQIGPSGKRVWLPAYGYGPWTALKKTDELNRRIWRSLGFRVSSLGDFHPFASNLGAAHCIKKYLKRRG